MTRAVDFDTRAGRDALVGGLSLQLAALREIERDEPGSVTGAIDLLGAAAAELSALPADAPRAEVRRTLRRTVTFINAASDAVESLLTEDAEASKHES